MMPGCWSWKETVNKYVFSRSKVAEKMLARLYEGAYHPIIHLAGRRRGRRCTA
jgi:hypothetical protein